MTVTEFRLFKIIIKLMSADVKTGKNPYSIIKDS